MTEVDSTNIPYGYCHCGCGQQTKISPRTDTRLGHKQGQPLRYIYRHKPRGAGRKRKDRYCELCGQHFYNERPKRFCSPECRSDGTTVWNKGLKGYEMPNAHRRVWRSCLACGKDFWVHIEAERPGKYCSMKCYLATRWPDNRVTTACVICGTLFTAAKSTNRITCSEPCRRKRIGEMNSGERCHFWRGGKMAPYDAEWKAVRRKTLERDGYECVLCGSEHRPEVHHIIPYRYSNSHQIENLVTLCRSCHAKEELKVNAASRAGLRARWHGIQSSS